jgi:hypothetical protein
MKNCYADGFAVGTWLKYVPTEAVGTSLTLLPRRHGGETVPTAWLLAWPERPCADGPSAPCVFPVVRCPEPYGPWWACGSRFVVVDGAAVPNCGDRLAPWWCPRRLAERWWPCSQPRSRDVLGGHGWWVDLPCWEPDGGVRDAELV